MRTATGRARRAAGVVFVTSIVGMGLLPTGAARGHDHASCEDDGGGWTPLSFEREARWNASIAVLDDGRVVVAGGTEAIWDEFGTELASAELYDPDTGEWTPLPSLPVPAHAMWTAALGDDKVLVAGGLSAHPAGFSHFPATNSYILDVDHPEQGWKATGPMPYGMWAPYGLNHAITLYDGRILVRGGIDTRSVLYGVGVSDQAAIFDPWTGRWDVTRATTGPIVQTVKGSGGAIHRLAAAEFGGDADSDRLFWFTADSAAFGPELEGQYLHLEGASHAGNNGDFFVLRVADTHDALIAFNPAASDEVLGSSARYRVGGRRPQTRMPHTTVTGTAVRLLDGRVFVAGGHDQRGLDSPYVMLFDPWSGRWSSAANMPIVPDEDQIPGAPPCTASNPAGCVLGDHAGARWGPYGGLLPDGTVLVGGGNAYSSETDGYLERLSAARWSPYTGKWTVLPARALRVQIAGTAIPLWREGGFLITGPDAEPGRGQWFDWWTRTFEDLPSFGPADDAFGGAVLGLPDGHVMVVCGLDPYTGLGSAQAYEFAP